MLIDATHPEETRVAVVDGTRLEEFDFEMAARRQIKSNIYLAKVTRVEPSLQAAFVEYGGNRHGFLPFPEIHPDYYRIPVGDRPIYEDDQETRRSRRRRNETEVSQPVESEAVGDEPVGHEAVGDETVGDELAADADFETDRDETLAEASAPDPFVSEDPPAEAEYEAPAVETEAVEAEATAGSAEPIDDLAEPVADLAETYSGDLGSVEPAVLDHSDPSDENGAGEPAASGEQPAIDVVGGDEVEDVQRRRRAQMPHYKIQEVIKRRQIMLVQVSKEERGNKGAAVTTFLSLPGRYCVLMPNTSRGGGVSRKIANPADRKRMKELISDLEVPEGMSVILRTAGVERSKAEIKRDLEYLLRLWENIRTLTLESTAPALIYEEGNLVKRAIRDLYSRDIDSIEIAGEEGYRQAKDFMRMLMPSHAKRVQPYRDPSIPLFFRYQVESQIDLIHNPVAHLKSGGYIVINQTEALVSIDVNSGRSTRERNIEETALKTNLEAADEIARQLRLRDMGGLIVIDFIDMDEPRHDAQVERRLKEAMKNDRARIQVGRISPFGLLELSRQRLHPSLIETHFHTCAHCLGTGLVRSIESASLLVLRAIEEEGIRQRAAEISVTVAGNIALYILNQKRGALIDIEHRYGFSVRVQADDALIAPEHRIERLRPKAPGTELPALSAPAALPVIDVEDEDIEEEDDSGESVSARRDDGHGEGEPRRKRRRNRRRRGGRSDEAHGESHQQVVAADEVEAHDQPVTDERADEDHEHSVAAAPAAEQGEASDEGAARRRRRGRRGGRGRSRRGDEDGREEAVPAFEEQAAVEVEADEQAAEMEVVGIAEREAASAEPVVPAEPPVEPPTEPMAGEGREQAVEKVVVPLPEPEPVVPEEPVARQYEIVNQPPAQPRRGFWKRLVE
jgi:ribonuclease E